VEVNTYGSFYVSKHAAKLMIDNISSNSSTTGDGKVEVQLSKSKEKNSNDKTGSDLIKKVQENSHCNGVIIFIASVASFEGMLGQSVYAASKNALNGMVLPMARDLGKFKIRVNSICPGAIETPMIFPNGQKSYDNHTKAIQRNSPLNVIGRPEHIAQAVEYMVKNDFVNGAIVRVDGGSVFPMF